MLHFEQLRRHRRSLRDRVKLFFEDASPENSRPSSPSVSADYEAIDTGNGFDVDLWTPSSSRTNEQNTSAGKH